MAKKNIQTLTVGTAARSRTKSLPNLVSKKLNDVEGASTKNTKFVQATRASTGSADPESLIGDYLEVLGLDMSRSVIVCKPVSAHVDFVKIPITLLAVGRHGSVNELLLKNGLISLARRFSSKEIANYLLDAAEGCDVRVIDKPGYYDLEIGGVKYSVLVSGGKPFWLGNEPTTGSIVLVGDAAKGLNTQKTLAIFNKQVTPILIECPRVLVVLAFALAATLVRKFGRLPVSLAIVGLSSQGKTVVQQFVSHLINGRNDVQPLFGTEIGVHDHMVAHPDQPVFFDDVHRSQAAAPLLQALMDVGNAGGRMISARSNGGAILGNVTCTLIVSGERNIAETASAARQPLNSGIYARVLEMYLGQHGMFDGLCGRPDAASLAKDLAAYGVAYSGLIGQALAKAVAGNWDRVQKLWVVKQHLVRSRILKAAQVEDVDGISNRLLDGLTFATFICCLLPNFKVAAISYESVYEAFGLVFREHLERLQAASSPIAKGVIEAVRLYIQSNPARFLQLGEAGDLVRQNGLAGYRKRVKGGPDLYLFFPGLFHEKFIKEFGQEAFDHLRDARYLQTQKSRHNQMLVRVPTGPGTKASPKGEDAPRHSFVAISEAILYAEE